MFENYQKKKKKHVSNINYGWLREKWRIVWKFMKHKKEKEEKNNPRSWTKLETGRKGTLKI